MSEPSLAALQHWVLSVLTRPGDLPDKLHAAAEEHVGRFSTRPEGLKSAPHPGLGVADVVAEKRGLAVEVRIGIYARAYVMRLIDCLRADFPLLRAFAGDPVFDAFARAYIIERPPSSPSLFDLGAAFPQFLDETKPGEEAILALPAELARLDRARSEAGRAAGSEDDPPDDAESPFAWLGEEVCATPCLRLLELAFPLRDFIGRIDAGEQPDVPAPRRTFVAVSRSAYRVHVAELEPWQFAFLRACENPASVAAAAREAGANLADVTLWLPVAVSRGYARRATRNLRASGSA